MDPEIAQIPTPGDFLPCQLQANYKICAVKIFQYKLSSVQLSESVVFLLHRTVITVR